MQWCIHVAGRMVGIGAFLNKRLRTLQITKRNRLMYGSHSPVTCSIGVGFFNSFFKKPRVFDMKGKKEKRYDCSVLSNTQTLIVKSIVEPFKGFIIVACKGSDYFCFTNCSICGKDKQSYTK